MEPVEWLKSTFQEAEYDPDSPQPKRIKFCDMSAELQSQFPTQTFSSFEVSRLIHNTFPCVLSKPCTKSRQKHLLGLERTQHVSLSSDTILDCSALLAENQQLKERVRVLEQQSLTSLCHQADAVIARESAVTQGPHTLTAFHELDFDTISAELQTRAPDLYQLCMTLGNTQRNQHEDSGRTVEEVKAITSMCSLLNARSARMKGPQLLIGMMLVARATSKQV